HKELRISTIIVAVVPIAVVPVRYFIIPLSQPYLLRIGRSVCQYAVKNAVVVAVQGVVCHTECCQEVVHLVVVFLTELTVDQYRHGKVFIFEIVIPAADPFRKNTSQLFYVRRRTEYWKAVGTDEQRTVFVYRERFIRTGRQLFRRVIALVGSAVQDTIGLSWYHAHRYIGT